jgi:hypothetical protein
MGMALMGIDFCCGGSTTPTNWPQKGTILKSDDLSSSLLHMLCCREPRHNNFKGIHLKSMCLIGVYLIRVYSMGIALINIYFKGMYLKSMYLKGIYLISVHLIGVHLMGVYGMGIALMGVHLTGRASHYICVIFGNS